MIGGCESRLVIDGVRAGAGWCGIGVDDMARYEGIAYPGEAGEEGANLESCSPLQYRSRADLTPEFVKSLLGRLLASSYREPHTLSLYVLRRACLLRLLSDVKSVLSRERTLLDIVVPDTGRAHVFGDIHGDLHSLAEGLVLSGLPSSTNTLVFAGDCVDRGSWGVEVLIAVFALKLWQPNAIYLIRGNHESTGTMCRYGFKAEVERKLGGKLYPTFTHVLRELPCAGLVRTIPASAASPATVPMPSTRRKQRNPASKRGSRPASSSSLAGWWTRVPVPGERRILVAHGGLFRAWSPSTRDSLKIGSLGDLANAHRQIDDPYASVIEDVLWSDPQTKASDVAVNNLRGAGILYGRGAVEGFFRRNYVCGLIRGHEGPDMREQRKEMNDMLEGYSVDMELANGGFVATVFSAADYRKLFGLLLFLDGDLLSNLFVFLLCVAMDKPRGNKGCIATLRGKSCGPMQILPEFTTFKKRFQPTNYELFYDPMAADRPATPRN